MSLSEKGYIRPVSGNRVVVYLGSDVKDFIKELKEQVLRKGRRANINELAGEALI